MAPQNSTLIHEYVESTSELSRYSPILPLKTEEYSGRRMEKSICCKAINVEHEEEIPIWICGEPRFVSGIQNTTTCNEIIQALIDDEIQNVNLSDVAASRDLNDYVIIERWRDVEQELSGEQNIKQIWEEWGDEGRKEVKLRLKIKKKMVDIVEEKTIPEKLIKVKKEKLNFVTKILKRILRQGEDIQNQLSSFNDSAIDRKSRDKIKKYMNQKYGKKALLDGFLINATSNLEYSLGYKNNNFNSAKKTILPKKQSVNADSEPCEYFDIDNDDDDELMLVLENNYDDSDSGVHVENRTNHQNNEKHFDLYEHTDNNKYNNSKNNILITKTTNNINETPKRKFRTKREYDLLKQHTINNNNNNKHKNRFDIIRYEILLKMDDMKKLYRREEELSKCLYAKCAKYKEENEIYNTKIGLEMCIEEVQKNLEIYTKEIIQNEQDLFRTKIEIEEKCRILDELRKMLKLEDTEEARLKEFASLEIRHQIQLNTINNNLADVEFVDNIYEFCDNNESMIV